MQEDYFSAEYLAKQYDKMAESYNDSRHLYDNSLQLEELDELVDPGNKVLDVGCGSGIPVAKYFVEHGCEVIGFDVSKEMIRLAMRNVPRGDFFQADVLAIELPSNTYNLVVSFYCVFHIEKSRQEEVFQKFYEALIPGGYSYFTLAGEKYTNEKEFQGTKRFGDCLLPYAHFSEEKYREILTSTGFTIISMEELTIGGETLLWVLVSK